MYIFRELHTHVRLFLQKHNIAIMASERDGCYRNIGKDADVAVLNMNRRADDKKSTVYIE